MGTDPPATSFAVLGLVDKVPDSSGYELVAVAGQSLRHFWPVSQTLLYRELDRLGRLGWVEATRVEQVHAPSKWTYRVSPAGQEALAAWLGGPIPATSGFRSGVLLKFFFAHRLAPHQVRSLLADYRRSLQAQCDEYTAIIDKLEGMGSPAARSGRLTALHGLRTAEARLHWVDEIEAPDDGTGDA